MKEYEMKLKKLVLESASLLRKIDKLKWEYKGRRPLATFENWLVNESMIIFP